MTTNYLRRIPHTRKDGLMWWFEERAGIKVYVDIRLQKYPGIIGVQIPWRALRGALARKDRKA